MKMWTPRPARGSWRRPGREGGRERGTEAEREGGTEAEREGGREGGKGGRKGREEREGGKGGRRKGRQGKGVYLVSTLEAGAAKTNCEALESAQIMMIIIQFGGGSPAPLRDVEP